MLALSVAILALAAQEPSIDGRWANPDESVIIEIVPCGEARCGTVRWASEQAIADARKGIAQLVGSDLLTGLTPSKPGLWQGKLFIPDKNMRVKGKIALLADGQLKVSGCAFLICKSQLWKRFEQALPAAK